MTQQSIYGLRARRQRPMTRSSSLTIMTRQILGLAMKLLPYAFFDRQMNARILGFSKMRWPVREEAVSEAGPNAISASYEKQKSKF